MIEVFLRQSTDWAFLMVRDLSLIWPGLLTILANNHKLTTILSSGTYRHLRGDGQLLAYGRCRGDQRVGPCLRVSNYFLKFIASSTSLMSVPGRVWRQLLLLPWHRPPGGRVKGSCSLSMHYVQPLDTSTHCPHLHIPCTQEREEEGVYLYPGLAKAVVGVWSRPAREERYNTQGYK